MPLHAYVYIYICYDIHSAWKFDAFTCFAASSWGGKNCGSRCVLRPAGILKNMFLITHNLPTFSAYLVIYRLCQYHSELDCARYGPCEIGDEVMLK